MPATLTAQQSQREPRGAPSGQTEGHIPETWEAALVRLGHAVDLTAAKTLLKRHAERAGELAAIAVATGNAHRLPAFTRHLDAVLNGYMDKVRHSAALEVKEDRLDGDQDTTLAEWRANQTPANRRRAAFAALYHAKALEELAHALLTEEDRE